MCCGRFFEFCSSSDAWAVLLRVWWIPLPETPLGSICIPRHSSSARDLNLGHSCQKSCNVFAVSWLASELCVCARFRSESEPVAVFAENVQRKVSQCVTVVCLSFAPVQMHGLFCCAFGGYPSQKHLQGTFAFRGIPALPWI